MRTPHPDFQILLMLFRKIDFLIAELEMKSENLGDWKPEAVILWSKKREVLQPPSFEASTLYGLVNPYVNLQDSSDNSSAYSAFRQRMGVSLHK